MAPGLPPTITVELLGVARLIARVEALEIPYPQEGTVGALLRGIAAQAPALVGTVLGAEEGTLAAGFVVSLDGRGWTRDPAAPLGGMARALLLSNVAGG